MCVGLNDFLQRLEMLKADKMSYRTFRRKLPDFLFEIDEGNGESYIANVITDTYKKYDLRSFTGKTKLLEYKLDGSYKDIVEILNDLDINKCYSNEFEGVIAINTTALSNYMNWEQFDFFVESIKKISKYASIVLFVNIKTEKERKLYEKLTSELHWFEEYKVENYNTKELVEMVIEKLDDMGINITARKALSKALVIVVETLDVKVCRDIELVIDEIVRFVDFYRYMPEINMNSIERIKKKYKGI